MASLKIVSFFSLASIMHVLNVTAQLRGECLLMPSPSSTVEVPPDVHDASRTAGYSLAGNPPLALLLHPVLEHPVAVEHYALVAAIFVLPFCVPDAGSIAAHSNAPCGPS